MAWNHLVLEGYCLFSKDKEEIPRCCKYEPGILGLHCLDYDEEQHIYCPFFAYGNARTSLVLTGNHGEEVAHKTYSSDCVDEKEWMKNENLWIEKWKSRLTDK